MILLGSNSFLAHSKCLNISHFNKNDQEILPVSNQGELGVCYGHSFATLLNYELNKDNAKSSNKLQLLSPLATSQFVSKSSIIGNRNSCFNIKKPVSICSLEALEGDSSSFDSFSSLESMYLLLKNINNYDDLNFKNNTSELCQNPFFAKTSKDFLTPETFKLIKNNKFETFLRKYTQDTCKPALKLPKTRCRKLFSAKKKDSKKLLKKLDQALNSRPVSILYCSDILEYGDNDVYSEISETYEDNKRFKTCPNDQGYAHFSAVVGKRDNNGKCEYLIQNSWGESCTAYSKEFECKKGRIWIGEQTLKKVILGVEYIKY